MSYKLGRNVSFQEVQHELDGDTLLLVESAWVDDFAVSLAKEFKNIESAIGLSFHIIEREGEPDMFDFILAWRWWNNLDKDGKIAQRPSYD